MKGETSVADLPDLLNEALARELQVSVQHMLQHAVEAGRATSDPAAPRGTKQSKFVASHSLYWLPGATLKKVAITEMRHAEAIAERLVLLGRRPTTEPNLVSVGDSVTEMLELNREEERGAIELYTRIIAVAQEENDLITMKLFQRILKDERAHHGLFTNLLAEL